MTGAPNTTSTVRYAVRLCLEDASFLFQRSSLYPQLDKKNTDFSRQRFL